MQTISLCTVLRAGVPPVLQFCARQFGVFLNDAGCNLSKMLLTQKRKDDAIQLQLMLI